MPFRAAGGGEFGSGPRFDAVVPPGGYLWWYADGLSDCGRYGFSVISFVGSVFSPYYKWKGRTNPDDHCCINVAIYSPGENLWAMTERGRDRVRRDAATFSVGPSSLEWDGEALTIRFDEIAVPKPPMQILPKRIKGIIRVRPSAVTSQPFEIDGEGKHKWWPIGPTGEASMQFDDPSRPDWKGHGYLDCNWGANGLEEDFDRWDWARGDTSDGGAVLLYDTYRKDRSQMCLSLRFDKDGNVEHVLQPPRTKLKRAFWGVPRFAHADPGFAPKILKTLEDGPFYCRTVIDTQLMGERVELMHESFDGRRFRSNIVKAMLCFRMPRRR